MSSGIALHEGSTDALADSVRADVRALLDRAFNGEFSDDDWHHALGGTHVWMTDDDRRVISHGSIVERTIACAGHPLRAGYVEAVATHPSHRRHGYGSRVMSRITEILVARYELGALSTGTPGLYERFGWQRWRGPSFVEAPHGRERTADEDAGIMILRTPQSPNLDLDGTIVCDWRAGDVW